MGTTDLAILAAFVVVYGLVSRRVEESPLTGPMVFVGFGLLMGSAGLDAFDVRLESTGVEVLAETTLALLLFADATRIDAMRLRRETALPARMLLIGLPLAVAIGTGIGAAVFDAPVTVVALIAAILAPTDAALGETVVTSPRVPVRIRQSLNVESGLNDGIALPAVTVFVAMVAEESEFSNPGSWVRFTLEQIGYGALVGVAVGGLAGWAVREASRRGWMEGIYRQLSVLGVAALTFATATGLDGNGFIATFVCGLTFGSLARAECDSVADFTDDIAHLLAMISFVVFGAVVVGPSLDQLDLRVAVYVVASLVIVRPAAIAISLVGSHLRWPTVAFLGWFGPRGLASILFAIIAIEDAHEADLELVSIVMSWTVLVSIVAHGLSAGPAADRYGRWWAGRQDDTMVESEHVTLSRIRGIRRGRHR